MNASTLSNPSAAKDILLRRSLQANALFTGFSALVLVAAARPLSGLFELPVPVAFITVGVILAGYAIVLWIAAKSETLDPRLGLAAAVLDAAWVIGSVAELALGWPPMSLTGKWIVAIVADIVGVFAIVQFYAWWRMRSQR